MEINVVLLSLELSLSFPFIFLFGLNPAKFYADNQVALGIVAKCKIAYLCTPSCNLDLVLSCRCLFLLVLASLLYVLIQIRKVSILCYSDFTHFLSLMRAREAAEDGLQDITGEEGRPS